MPGFGHPIGSAENGRLIIQSPVKLYVGSGAEKRAGWICIDANPDLDPDIVAPANQLSMFQDDFADAIEACHLLEHLTLADARSALREWHRVLKPGGELMLELPNLLRCFEILGRHSDDNGFDFGMIGIFGWPPMIAAEGLWQVHKWGWTPETLSAELTNAGYVSVEQVPIRQTWRRATAYDRDMRIHARK